MIFLNLPTRDLPAAKAFFQALGYSFNPQFEDETAACLVIEEGHSCAMLCTHEKFRHFAQVGPVDPLVAREVLICLSVPSREAVDALIEKVVAAGGKEFGETDDYGFMYGRGFIDLDGHGWQFMWMDATRRRRSPPDRLSLAR